LESTIDELSNNGNLASSTPTSYEEASKDEKWRLAAKSEYDSLINNHTWELVELPPGKKCIGCKWIFRTKEDENGNITKYKARLVAQGYTQKHGIDYNETFAPVANFTTIRTMLAVAALKGYTVHQLDISNAYLHADVTEEIYMKQPEGFEKKGNNGIELVCKLKKSLYGLKQAARNWNEYLNKWLINHGFTRSQVDPCLYTYSKDNIYLALAIYVDDIISITNNSKFREKNS
jgi:hypothetical protein